MTTERGTFGFDDFQTAIQTPEGSTVANVLLRQLRCALGLDVVAMPLTPAEVWDQTLDQVTRLAIANGVPMVPPVRIRQ